MRNTLKMKADRSVTTYQLTHHISVEIDLRRRTGSKNYRVSIYIFHSSSKVIHPTKLISWTQHNGSKYEYRSQKYLRFKYIYLQCFFRECKSLSSVSSKVVHIIDFYSFHKKCLSSPAVGFIAYLHTYLANNFHLN
jgi:hypothetical protein